MRLSYILMNHLKPFFIWLATPLFLVSCAQTSSPMKVASSTPQEKAIAKRVFSLVNAQRAGNGKRALRGSSVLNNLAQTHSKFLATNNLTEGQATHFGSRNRAQYAFLKHGIENLGEITYILPASTPDPAGTTVQAWIKSVKHRSHINQSWELTGIGVYKTSDKVYFTMLVGVVPAGVPRSMQPRVWR